MTAIGLALGASVLWGVGDFFGGRHLAAARDARRASRSRRLAGLARDPRRREPSPAATFLGGRPRSPPPMAAGLAGAIGLARPLPRHGDRRDRASSRRSPRRRPSIPVTVGTRPRGTARRDSSSPVSRSRSSGVVLVSREPGSGEWRLSAGVPLALARGARVRLDTSCSWTARARTTRTGRSSLRARSAATPRPCRRGTCGARCACRRERPAGARRHRTVRRRRRTSRSRSRSTRASSASSQSSRRSTRSSPILLAVVDAARATRDGRRRSAARSRSPVSD